VGDDTHLGTVEKGNTVHKSFYAILAALALLILTVCPMGAQETATLYVNSAGSGANLAGVFTSPYTGTVNGGPTIDVICDDFADNSYVPETWTAFVTPMSSLTSGTTDTDLRWLNTTGATMTEDSQTLNQTQAYEVAAVLAIEIVQAPSGSQAQEDLSYALWGLFYPTGVPDNTGAFTWLANAGDTTDLANAENYIDNAVNFVLNPSNSAQVQADVNSATIYSYDPAANPNGPVCGSGACVTSPPQELITITPIAASEASTPILLAVDLLGFIALMGFLRKRMARNN
jgi:hypothetical protein